ncbi:hypothetical protein D3C85_139680 [compost metagenome]
MDKTAKVSLKRLFIVVCSLKIASSAVGWYFDQPWLFGLALPLLFMVAYIVVGYNFRDRELSAEKFADSCYYLGFIFTIVSIVFSLVDIPNIGNDMTSIAVRFGAAMVSTVLGLFVRVALVSFRPNAEDALTNVEDEVLASSRRLTEEFNNAFDDLQDFRGNVSSAAKDSVALVNTQFVALAEQNAAQMSEFFAQMSRLNKEMLLCVAQDIRNASLGLTRVVNEYEGSIKATVSKIDTSVAGFSHHLIRRLNAVEFPDDIFSRKLDAPIASLSERAGTLGAGIGKLSDDVVKAARAVDKSVGEINLKAESMAQTLDVVRQIAAQQEQLAQLMSAQQEGLAAKLQAQQESLAAQVRAQQELISQGFQRQTQELSAIAQAFGKFDASLERLIDNLSVSHESTARLAGKVDGVNSNNAALLEALRESVASLTHAFASASHRDEQVTDGMHPSRQTSPATEARLETPGARSPFDALQASAPISVHKPD